MPVPANVIARRNISVATGSATIPDYPGIQNIIFLGTTGKPDLPVYAPPYAPNTPVPAGTKYLDVMDDGTGPLPVSPGPKYVCYLVYPAVEITPGVYSQFVVDADTFNKKDIRHNFAGWPNLTE